MSNNNEKYQTKTASKVNITGNVKAKSISPQKSDFKTVGITLSSDEAVKLGRNLLILGTDTDLKGDIVVTGHKKPGRVTCMRYVEYQR